MKAILENKKIVTGNNKREIVSSMTALDGSSSILEYIEKVKERNVKWNGQEMKVSSIESFFDECVKQKIILMWVQ